MTVAANDVRATHHDLTKHELSIGELEAVAAAAR